MFELVANVSLLFTELPYLQRFPAAAAAGFQSTESWWPFPSATPTRADADRLVEAVAACGIPLTALNLFGGDQDAGERGIVCRPDRRDEFAANLEAVAALAERTGARGFNALYGQRRADQSDAEQDATALANLAAAVHRLAPLGGTVYVEPQTRATSRGYPIATTADAAAIVLRVREHTGLDNIGILFDTFHLTNNGEDLVTAIDDFAPLIAHVQLADSPGRGEPGTGSVSFAAVLEALARNGYRGRVAAEYSPTAGTTGSFAWIADMPRLAVG
jgi:hydroxypyruvate isomerase